ncbi:MFS transporter [Echinicola shivajiensis]|uniref:MFS transporter n=1 Tax=Echinicola shivajiensis TaxID=1035916 RepID=UPI001BFC2904|nr:MFS transporter [Echinicola shivajiensis]
MKNSKVPVTRQQRIPVAIWALTASVFAIGTAEVVMIGLLPTIAREFSISTASSGWLITSYAMGVAMGGPVVTAFTNTISRKKLLCYLILLFVLSNALAASSYNYLILISGRVLSGVAHGVFVGTGANIASNMVHEEKRATAIAIMFTGLTVAMVTGVPLGTYIGQHFGWRLTFAAISVIGLFCLLANQLWLPNKIKQGSEINLKEQFKVLRSSSMLIGFSLTLFSFAALFGTFTYLAPLLEEISGFSKNQITLILFLYGISVAFGNLLGGKLSNRSPAQLLAVLFTLLTVNLGLMADFLPSKIPTLILVATMGTIGFATVPGMQLYIIQLSEKYRAGAEDVSSVLNISAFNIGIALGSTIGGIIISSPFGLQSVPSMGAVFSAIAILMAIISIKKEKRITKKQLRWNTEN